MSSIFTYLDRVLYLYPGIQGVTFWQTQPDGTPWNDAYDGIVWENTEIKKPTKRQLDAIVGYSEEYLKQANAEIYKKLDEIDTKSIRALRTGDTNRLESLEQEAVALREQLIK